MNGHGARILLALALLAPGTRAAQEERPAPLAEHARALFEASCVRCHGPERAKAGLRLDRLAWDPADEEALERWAEVLDRLEAGEMPPEGEPRPDAAAVAGLTGALRTAFLGLEGASGPRYLRRLNRVQVRNSLRDLLAIDVVLEDPTSSFPPDDVLEGFDVLAEGQVTSDFLLRQVLLAARRALDLATFDGPRPEPETHALFDAADPRPGNFAVNHTEPADGTVFLFLNDERSPGDPRGQALTTSRSGARAPGWYDFVFTLESRGRGTAWPGLERVARQEWQVYRPSDLHRLEIYLSAPHGSSAYTSRRRILVEALDLADGERVTLERRYWLGRGWRLELAFGNAFAGHLDGFLEAIGAAELVARFAHLPRPELLPALAEHTHAAVATADAPRIVVHAAAESGPHHASWPPPSHVAAHGAPDVPPAEHLAAFAARAFRRPVPPEELAPYVRLAAESPEGLRTALEAILCSPRFLYLFEPEGELDGWALAARLAYFLWNAPPDARLAALAAEGRLGEPGVLRAEAERLLADPRSDELVTAFTWGWLGLQNALDMTPDPMRFPEYHRSRLQEAAVAETRAVFRHVLDANRPVAELLAADYTFVNADLARLYGLESVATTVALQRVSLPAELGRGGVLGQAAVLTASANGVDTSPVVRGVWVLEHLLGTPPDPPPPDVPIPEPDTRGELTIREIFDQHRSIESCNECHRSIDPLGFALESFDAIGRWRDAYESGLAIDPSGRMPDGTTFDDVHGMKRALLAELPLFTRHLAERLAAYAAGRTLRPADRPAIERIVARASEPGAGLRDLVLAVVESGIFRRR
ncbi:MAG TPA: DUF1592 domain-containing protein [Planctomycetota bacterium]